MVVLEGGTVSYERGTPLQFIQDGAGLRGAGGLRHPRRVCECVVLGITPFCHIPAFVVGLAPNTGERQRGRSQGREPSRLLTALEGKNVLVNLDGQP